MSSPLSIAVSCKCCSNRRQCSQSSVSLRLDLRYSMSPQLLVAVRSFLASAVRPAVSSCSMSRQLLIAVRSYLPNAARPEVTIHQGHFPPLLFPPLPNAARPEVTIHQGHFPPLLFPPVLPGCNNQKLSSQTGSMLLQSATRKRPFGPGIRRVPDLNDHIQSVKLLTAKSPSVMLIK